MFSCSMYVAQIVAHINHNNLYFSYVNTLTLLGFYLFFAGCQRFYIVAMLKVAHYASQAQQS